MCEASAMGIVERIKEIGPEADAPTFVRTLTSPRATEGEIARTQKNKATEHHLGSLKAKLAKLRTQVRALCAPHVRSV